MLDSPGVNDGDQPGGSADPARGVRSVAVCELDGELRCLRVNEAMAAITRQPLADHLGRRPQEILPPPAGPLDSLCSQVLASGEAIIDADLRIAAPDDRWLVTIVPRRNDDGRPAGVTALFRSPTPLDALVGQPCLAIMIAGLVAQESRGAPADPSGHGHQNLTVHGLGA